MKLTKFEESLKLKEKKIIERTIKHMSTDIDKVNRKAQIMVKKARDGQ